MLERLVKKPLQRIWEKIASSVDYRETEHGIDFSYVFTDEYGPEAWEEPFRDLQSENPDKFAGLAKIIQEAANRTTEERQQLIEELTSPSKKLSIGGGDPTKFADLEQKRNQFLINVNSISPTNLANMQIAINSLLKENPNLPDN